MISEENHSHSARSPRALLPTPLATSPLSARERPAGLPTVAELGELVRLEAEEVGVLARVTRVVALLHDGRRDRGGHVAQEVGRLRAYELVDGQRELLGQRRRVVLAWLGLGLGF